MKTPLLPRGRGAFTLIEVLMVISIIGLLLVLAIGYFHYADYSAKVVATEVRRDAIRSALEGYQKDFGEYPEPATPGDAVTVANRKYEVAGAAMLYQVLSGDGNDQIRVRNLEPQFVSNGSLDAEERSQVKLASMPKEMWTRQNDCFYIVDGFGRLFQYIKAASVTPSAPSTAPVTINPSFDLWSFGKDVENTMARSIDILSNREIKLAARNWITNW